MSSLFILLKLLKTWAFEAGKEAKSVARQPHGKSEDFLIFSHRARRNKRFM
jgi:hypothetical protein